MAVHLNGLTFLDHFIEFFSSDADQGFLHSFSAAVTVKFRRNFLIDLHVKAQADSQEYAPLPEDL